MKYSLLAISKMEMFLSDKSVDREPVFAGRFYPDQKDVLINDISIFFQKCKKTSGNSQVRAIISPHAGYVYSGIISASAFSSIHENSSYKNIFLIGSSHSMSFKGASIYDSGDYNSPLGKFIVNREVAGEIKNANAVFHFPATSHLNEHSLEVQLPFIWYLFKEVPMIVPIIIGTNDHEKVKLIADALSPWFKPGNLFVISSDFSHYPSYEDAIENDQRVALSIASGDPSKFLSSLKQNSEKKINGLVTSMCGWTSCLTLMYLAENDDQLCFQLIDYCNSGDSQYHEKDKVVGYHAIALREKLIKK